MRMWFGVCARLQARVVAGWAAGTASEDARGRRQWWAYTVIVRPSQGSHGRHGGVGVDAEEAHVDRGWECFWRVWVEKEDVDQEEVEWICRAEKAERRRLEMRAVESGCEYR